MPEVASTPIDAQPERAKAKPRPQTQRRRLNDIYALPLPLECHPLPAFIPQNPLSILRIAYAILSSYLSSPSSHPQQYSALLSAETQSVHVTNPIFIRALWEKGFFGKGTLSRSDPSWLDREKRRLGLVAQQTSEEYTESRRDERRQIKLNRALLEREAIEQQLRQEGKEAELAEEPIASTQVYADVVKDGQITSRDNDISGLDDRRSTVRNVSPGQTNRIEAGNKLTVTRDDDDDYLDTFPEVIEDQEYLQLSPEEAFFLSYTLGVLTVFDPITNQPLSTTSLFSQLRSSSYYPPVQLSSLRTDDPFLLRYVVYHHFRSLGWVLRGGSKFSVDYLLYNRGPVFSHAEYAVLVLPSYSHPYWFEDPARAAEVREKEKREWYWLHCINRVQAHVHKTLVLAYVDVPPPSNDGRNIGKLLKQYKVREFAIRRWLLNRSRD